MSRRRSMPLSIALAAVLLPIAAQAQERQPPPEVQQLVAEMRQLQAELQPVQQQALQDSAIMREQEEVSTVVREAMVAADPANGPRLDRMEAIMEEARTAQQTGDTAKVTALATEAAQLQPQVEAAQEEALGQPGIQARIAQFQNNLRSKMIELDPNAKARIERLEELSQRLQRAMGGNG